MRTLDDVATTSPGIVLVGESVDVDVDEPSITIRWSILGCGDGFVLSGSEGVHGSKTCGLPADPLYIFVDNDIEPAATYDPSQIPFNRDTGHRRSIQNLVQFDSDHVLDVHEARMYPFDTYFLSSTLRAMSFKNETVPIRKARLSTLLQVLIYSLRILIATQTPLMSNNWLVVISICTWVLTHVTIGHVIIARRLEGMKPLFKHLISSGAILVAIPQLRNSMPDAPGLDGVLIDCIGFFPQMIITGISVVTSTSFSYIAYAFIFAAPRPRPPPSPSTTSSSMEIAQYEMYRLMKHLKGDYVFPPVKPSHRLRPSDPSKPVHRRIKTMSKIMEAGEVSHWSDEER
ncbi:hypothetical protein BDQ17DRAFT_1419434 [Cyathus striatus]|nr:hypothetical protein BDQ17DRAFT_1419434 [Cyathus striatus]